MKKNYNKRIDDIVKELSANEYSVSIVDEIRKTNNKDILNKEN